MPVGNNGGPVGARAVPAILTVISRKTDKKTSTAAVSRIDQVDYRLCRVYNLFEVRHLCSV